MDVRILWVKSWSNGKGRNGVRSCQRAIRNDLEKGTNEKFTGKKTEYTTYDFPMDTTEWYKLWFFSR